MVAAVCNHNRRFVVSLCDIVLYALVVGDDNIRKLHCQHLVELEELACEESPFGACMLAPVDVDYEFLVVKQPEDGYEDASRHTEQQYCVVALDTAYERQYV